MDNEVPLPPPRRLRHRSPARAARPSSPSSIASSFRKARRLSRFDDRSSQPSSDPALFSSDDIPASGLENYNAPVASSAGRKRRYRGTWWGEQVVDPKRKRADFKEKRHMDSGVWMGSDESVAESSLPSEDAPNWGEDLLKTVLDPHANGKSPIEPSVAMAPPLGPLVSARPQPVISASESFEEPREHRFAREIVNDCLEKGQDSIDLGNLNLRFIPENLLRPLQHLTKLPSVTEAPTTENAYSSLQPFLRIYLPNNSLTNISSEVMELKDLKVLSVRNNKISTVPSSIRKLKALEALNVSVNRITYLPWGILELLEGELKHFTARPNPFPEIEESDIAIWHRGGDQQDDNGTPQDALQFTEYEGDPPADAWKAIRVATSSVERLDMDGQTVEPDTVRDISQTKNRAAHPPSLRELALRTLAKMPGLEHVTDAELIEFPPLLVPLFRLARSWRADGGWRCSICDGEYVHPRTRWTEWWDCTPHENGMKRPRASGERLRPLPFQRFGCSWACLP